MEQKNTMALVSMILGIVSIVLSCCCFMGLIPGSIGIFLGALSRGDGNMNRQATVGVITGIVGLILSVICGVVSVVMMANAGS